MATYSTNAIVLKKTKLAETDLIVTCLKPDGSQLRAVAKGARKPSSTFASRLELFSCVNLLCAEGKNLHIVREAKFEKSFSNIRSDVERIACASPAMELLARCTTVDIPQEDLYPLTLSFLQTVNDSQNYVYYKAYCAAHLIKTTCLLGFRPQLSHCAVCGEDTSTKLNNPGFQLPFSYEHGGVLCTHCARVRQTERINSQTANLLDKLINSRFSEITLLQVNDDVMLDALNYCKIWIILHLGIKLKSLDFYLQTLN